jgi:methionyl-tRNA formyltransferase
MSSVEPLIFFGTPEFAVPTLEALAAAGRRPLRIVAQPSRPAGRGQHELDPPVARWAKGAGIELLQPPRVRAPEFVESLRALNPGVAIVVAFGQIFPRALLDLPRSGCINLHASLLPRHRGAAPIQAAIAEGDVETGVTTMRMDVGLDTGPMLLQAKTLIGEHETAGELSARLAILGGALVVDTLARLEGGELRETPQSDQHVTLAPRLSRESGQVVWSRPAIVLERALRALTPWPGLTAELAGKPVKLVRATVLPVAPTNELPGTILGVVGEALAVATGDGTVFGITALQRPGRTVTAASDFARGERLQAGQRFE